MPDWAALPLAHMRAKDGGGLCRAGLLHPLEGDGTGKGPCQAGLEHHSMRRILARNGPGRGSKILTLGDKDYQNILRKYPLTGPSVVA